MNSRIPKDVKQQVFAARLWEQNAGYPDHRAYPCFKGKDRQRHYPPDPMHSQVDNLLANHPGELP